MDNEQLQTLVEQLSLTHFNKPFKHQARFNNRLSTTGGRYMLCSHDIEVNKKQWEVYGIEAVTEIIKHELCHYHLHIEGKGYRHRDQDFKALCQEVGAPAYCQPLPQRNVYVYKCSRCHQQYERKRRVDTTRYRCGVCRGELQLMRN